MDWGPDCDEPGQALVESRAGGGPAMTRAMVENPEDPGGRPIALLGHHLLHEPVERGALRSRLVAAEQSGLVDVACRQVAPGAPARVPGLDLQRLCRGQGSRGVAAPAIQDARLLVGTQVQPGRRTGRRGPRTRSLIASTSAYKSSGPAVGIRRA